ncbi:MAG TPA: ATP-dependent DNA helicase RecG [Oligoflexia bacterium]|nr:ATP-dependent DNA helicase RecG [Oligoflexia bacterium]HMR24909.1 ATP-dependent DNA helicase RecG [Oligoflexia bacterium]
MSLLHTDLQAIFNAIEFLKKTSFKSAVAVSNFSSHVDKVLEKHKKTLPENIFKEISSTLEGYNDKSLPEQKRTVLLIESICTQKKTNNPAALSENSARHSLQKPQQQEQYFKEEEHLPIKIEQWQKDFKKLNQSIQYIKGVGPVLAKKLKKVGIETVEELIKFFPRKYEDRRHLTEIKNLQDGQVCFIAAQVIFSGVAYYKGARKRVYEVIVQDDHGELKLKWFHFYEKQFASQTKVGQNLLIYGQVKQYGQNFEMHHPDIEAQGANLDSSSFGQIVPIYKDVQGVYPKTLRKIILSTLTQHIKKIACVLPKTLCQELNLNHPKKSIEKLHYPQLILNDLEIYNLQKIFIVEELFFYTLALFLRKNMQKKHLGIVHGLSSKTKEKLLHDLPFELTQDQKTVLTQILTDMKSQYPMNRLLQGDVGSGKTIVAILAALHAVDNGSQVVFLAPTEVLCQQHYQSITKLIYGFNVKSALLLGKQKKSEKNALLKQLKLGEIDIVVATHAVLEDDVIFKKLGLVIVDEQHRFGVYQRSKLKNKGDNPDVLVMSATPIPRTLALTLYGDLDISQIKQLPAGRKTIVSQVCDEAHRHEVYQHIDHALQQGRQAFIIYPLVEESEKIDLKDASSMAEHLQKQVFPQHKVGLIHGRMKGDEKNTVMQAFEKRDLDILVSTTVIEVGINIPNASIMVIEHPERFGLSQLHQLRGRVGRGEYAAKCFLIHPQGISELAKKRLKIFASTTDGFILAEEDLKVRGPGDFFGREQSGFPNFKSALFPRDLILLEKVRSYCVKLLQDDPDLEQEEHKQLKIILQEQWDRRIELMQVS